MREKNFKSLVEFIKQEYNNKDFIPLHAPVFQGNEKKYVIDAIDSTYVSSVGAYVNKFEEMMVNITGAKYAIAIVNGTNALHMALLLLKVKAEDEVLSQALTFIATANAINYIGAKPVFIDVDMDTLGMSPKALQTFLENNAEIRSDGFAYNKHTKNKISACVPMHTFGFPCRIDEIAQICENWNINLVEDAAESLGSYYKSNHTGIFGKIGVFSFNGNKTVTSGGGGALITNDQSLAKHAKHLTTQAKIPHEWEFAHDEIGYNYRMPNLNAALACAQLEQLNLFVENKRQLADKYKNVCSILGLKYFIEPPNSKSNYWLNCLILNDISERNSFLNFTNKMGVMTRPVWELMTNLPMFIKSQSDSLINSNYLRNRIVNLPSSVRL